MISRTQHLGAERLLGRLGTRRTIVALSLVLSGLIGCSSDGDGGDKPTIGEADAALKDDVDELLTMLALPLGELRTEGGLISDCYDKSERQATYSVTAPITGPIGTERNTELLVVGALTELGYRAVARPLVGEAVVTGALDPRDTGIEGALDPRDTQITFGIDYVSRPPSKVEVGGITACLPSD